VQLLQLLRRAVQPGRDAVQFRPEFVEVGRHRRLRRAQLQRQRDQPLLGAVVQVALDAAPGLVGGGDDAGARGRQLGLRLGVRDRGGDQLGEVGQARLGVGRQRLGSGGADPDQPPQPPLHRDRAPDRGAHAKLEGHFGERAGRG
jgi:hypothetical protein